MNELTLKILDKNGNVLCSGQGRDFVDLVYTAQYQEGDRILLEPDEKNTFLFIQMDDAMGSAFCYVTGDVFYEIPFGEKRVSHSPKAFSGKKHYLYARKAREDEIGIYRNVAMNVYDQHGDTNCYPHAVANVETRGEAVFAARNAIDGIWANRSHGEWPYESWGINRQDDAEMSIYFGREVEIDKIVLVTRADFPHDSWWKQVTLGFSGAQEMVWELEKSELPHVITFEPVRTERVRLYSLIKADDPSPFPALSQIEVYGKAIL